MTTLTGGHVRELPPLQPVTATGWRRGLGNLLGKEFDAWFGTRRWLIQAAIWVLILNGITLATMSGEPDATADEQLATVLEVFLMILAMMGGIGLVITVQSALVGEKQLGTAAWVMSKPASRHAFYIAKVIANAVGFGLTAMIIPAVLFIIQATWISSLPLAVGPFLVGLSVIGLSMLFYLMLAMMLGAFFDSRGPVAAIGIGVLLLGYFVRGLLPPAVLFLTPWLVPDLGLGLALELPLPDNWFVPLVATAVWIALFTAVGLWRFNREEF
jgi:ABC-2 type transport system permease protein